MSSEDDQEVYNARHRTPGFMEPLRELGLVSSDGSFPKWAQFVSQSGRAFAAPGGDALLMAEGQRRALRVAVSTPGVAEAVLAIAAMFEGYSSQRPIDAYLIEIGAIEFSICDASDPVHDRGAP